MTRQRSEEREASRREAGRGRQVFSPYPHNMRRHEAGHKKAVRAVGERLTEKRHVGGPGTN
jgi:hypothetical protein